MVSDLHFPFGCEYGCYETPLLIRSEINQLPKPPAFVVLCGDLICSNREETCDSLDAFVAGFDMPVYMVIGNHEADPNIFDST